MLPPGARLTRVMALVDDEKYFTLRAGHQTGKTTCARWLVRHYNAGDRYACIWIDIQSARELPEPAVAFPVVLEKIATAVHRDLPHIKLPDLTDLRDTPQTAILHALRALARASARPVVVLIDEADGLVGPAMVSFLTQIREGYIDRSDLPFPHGLALIGRREVRDYAVSIEDRRPLSWLGTSSPFNINAEAPTLSLFSPADVAELLHQHTTHTGQLFLPESIDRIFYLSQGQPWLVNALADHIVDLDVPDRHIAATAAHVDAAKEALIQERRSHIDALVARLREPRVRRIIEPMLLGELIDDGDALNDDFAYVLGLGLLGQQQGQYRIANPIYKEVIPRVLIHDMERQLYLKPSAYVKPDGRLDMLKLMTSWQEFWREDGHLAAAGFSYKEAGPHLMLMAYLQRIVNGGGTIEREYALGRGALDLLVTFGGERHAIELKLRRDTRTLKRAQEQLLGYLDEAGLSEGWLVHFDLRKEVSWEDKLTLTDIESDGKHLHVVGC